MGVGGGRGSGFGERVPHTPKYFDQFLMVLLVNFTTRLAFARLN